MFTPPLTPSSLPFPLIPSVPPNNPPSAFMFIKSKFPVSEFGLCPSAFSCKWHHGILLYGQIMHIYVITFLYPYICWWTYRLVPHSVHFFTCFWDIIPNKSNLKKEKFILAHSSEVVYHDGKAPQREHGICSQEREISACALLLFFLFSSGLHLWDGATHL